jgi:hypothetical protein
VALHCKSALLGGIYQLLLSSVKIRGGRAIEKGNNALEPNQGNVRQWLDNLNLYGLYKSSLIDLEARWGDRAQG